MADTLSPPAENDPYDLGDTGRKDLDTGTSEPASPSSQPTNPPEPKATPTPQAEGGDSDRPRNPDGTFAKAKTNHPNFLREAAASLGYADEEIDDYSTAQLSAIVIRTQHQLANDRHALASARSVEAERLNANAPPPKAPEKDELLDLGKDEHGNPIPESDVSGPLLKVIKDLRKELREIKDGHKTLVQREESRQASATTTILDDGIEALNAPELFGEGSVVEFGADSIERNLRNALIGMAGIDLQKDTPRQVARKLNAALPKLREKIKPKPEAAEAYAIEQAKNGAKPPISTEQWNKSAVTKPTQRQANDLEPGVELAVRELSKKIEARRSAEQDLGLPD